MGNKNKKIRDIKTDTKQFATSFLLISILFSILLLLGLSVLVFSFPKWYVILATCLVFVGIIIWIVLTFLKENRANKYELYENCLKIKSMWLDVDIDLKKVFGAVPYRSYRDHIFHTSTSIKIIMKDKFQTIHLIHFIAEDPVALCNEIMTLATKAREKDNDKK